MPDNTLTPGEVTQMAHTLDDLKQQALNVLDRYYNHAQDLHSSRQLSGGAGDQNLVTTEEISNAQRKLNTRWQNAIDLVRQAVSKGIDTDDQNKAHIAQVGSMLRHT